ncbi:MAG: lipase family protein [Deltaproteobacteria bacterium]|nr:lipase family protein [Deltaproteobacteria bacterium]
MRRTMYGVSFRHVLLFALFSMAVACMAEKGGAETSPAPEQGSDTQMTFKSISPPYLDYEYFKGHQRYPFERDAATFSPVNAWWLVESAILSYADKEFAEAQFHLAGFDGVRFFTGRSTQCYVASNKEFAIVAFRGSETLSRLKNEDAENVFADLIIDLKIRQTDWYGSGKVHRGFKEALDEVWHQLSQYLAGLHLKDRRIWLTGHSLGAALATLAADRLRGVQNVYTFGSPKVGNAEFQNLFKDHAYRIVNNADIVTKLPPGYGYTHVGETWLIDRS